MRAVPPVASCSLFVPVQPFLPLRGPWGLLPSLLELSLFFPMLNVDFCALSLYMFLLHGNASRRQGGNWRRKCPVVGTFVPSCSMLQCTCRNECRLFVYHEAHFDEMCRKTEIGGAHSEIFGGTRCLPAASVWEGRVWEVEGINRWLSMYPRKQTHTDWVSHVFFSCLY